MKHERIGFPTFLKKTVIIETKTTKWRELDGQILTHSLLDAFKLSSCPVRSVSVFTQSLQSLTINEPAKHDVDSCLLCNQGNAQRAIVSLFPCHVSRIKEVGKYITGF